MSRTNTGALWLWTKSLFERDQIYTNMKKVALIGAGIGAVLGATLHIISSIFSPISLIIFFLLDNVLFNIIPRNNVFRRMFLPLTTRLAVGPLTLWFVLGLQGMLYAACGAAVGLAFLFVGLPLIAAAATPFTGLKDGFNFIRDTVSFYWQQWTRPSPAPQEETLLNKHAAGGSSSPTATLSALSGQRQPAEEGEQPRPLSLAQKIALERQRGQWQQQQSSKSGNVASVVAVVNDKGAGVTVKSSPSSLTA